jgi:hypothetical protein
MASDFPASLDAFPDPLVNSPLNSPSHAALHQDVNDAVEKIETKVGVGASPASGASDGQVLMADGSGGTEWASITADEIDSTGQPAQRVLASDGSGGAGWVSNETGLVKITAGTLSGTATNIVGCFSSDFTNYRIVIDSIVFSTAADLYWQLLNGTTPSAGNYRWGYLGINSFGTTGNSNSNGANEAYTGVTVSAGEDGQLRSSLTMDIFAPNLAQRTFANNHAFAYIAGNALRIGFSMNNTSTAFDGIRFLTATAATVTGNVTIYGYQKL